MNSRLSLPFLIKFRINIGKEIKILKTSPKQEIRESGNEYLVNIIKSPRNIQNRPGLKIKP